MAKAKLFNREGKEVGSYDLNPEFFEADINEHCVHLAVLQYLANQRQGTQSAKTRAEVRGGGRKPYSQKGTGRARQGSIRSPQFTGGGVVFAPKPRDYSFKLNRKMKRVALKSALTSLAQKEQINVVEEFSLSQIKTKVVASFLNTVGFQKAILVTDGVEKNLVLSANNIPGIKVTTVDSLNVYELLKYQNCLFTKAAVEKMGEVYHG